MPPDSVPDFRKKTKWRRRIIFKINQDKIEDAKAYLQDVEGLNGPQKQAALNAFRTRFSLIHGPPGTGTFS